VNLWLAPTATILAAIMAAVLTYRNSVRLNQKRNRLARVNLQLEQLYGPLFALSLAIDSAWKAMMKKHRPSAQTSLVGGQAPTEDHQVWVDWITNVFMPLNRQMVEVIVHNAHLLSSEGDTMPQCLLDLCAHVAGYEVVLKNWESGDFSQLLSLSLHPTDALLDYSVRTFRALRKEQAELLENTQSH
jgi:hypothetical protein